MTSSLTFNLALVADDQVFYLVLGIIALASLVALGGKFFVNLFEVVTAPAASLGHHGQNDNFFFSIVVVFLGGLIATFTMFVNQAAMKLNFHEYAVKVAGDAAASTNEVYRQIAADWGSNLMESRFALYFTDQLVFLPILLVLLWIIIGAIVFVGTKMMGANCTMADFLGSLAYGSFFMAIGFGMAGPFLLEALAGSATGDAIMPGGLAIVGIVLILYGIVLYLVGTGQAAQIAGGQVAVAIILLLIVVGGLGYWAYSSISPAFQEFLGQISSYNPGR